MCIRDRGIASRENKKGARALTIICRSHSSTVVSIKGLERAIPVSYTHLDVYKRQVPRLRPALGVGSLLSQHLVNDDEFRKIIAVLRLSVPYTGIILSTREKASFRDELASLGISQFSAGSVSYTHLDVYKRQGGLLYFPLGYFAWYLQNNISFNAFFCFF